jgi:hypothetical protein
LSIGQCASSWRDGRRAGNGAGGHGARG